MARTVEQSDNAEYFGRTVGGAGLEETVVPTVDLLGATTPRERGLSLGGQLRVRIHRAAAALGAEPGPEPQQVEDARRAAPHLLEEIEAVAEGAGLPLRDVLALNFSPGPAASWAHATPSPAEPGMVGWAARSEPLVACGAVVRCAETCAWCALAGCVGGPGLGRHLALGWDGPAGGAAASGLPWHLCCRLLLECASLDDAGACFRGLGMASLRGRFVVMACTGESVTLGGGEAVALPAVVASYSEAEPAEDADGDFEAVFEALAVQSDEAEGCVSMALTPARGLLFVKRDGAATQPDGGDPAIRVRLWRPGSAPLPQTAAELRATLPSSSPIALTAEEKERYAEEGVLHLPGFLSDHELEEMRRELFALMADRSDRPAKMSYSVMGPKPGFEPDPRNPDGVVGIVDQPLASSFWLDQISEPRQMAVLGDILSPDADFFNGKIRNKPPGYTNRQSMHQDWPYEPHSEARLAGIITYLDDTGEEEDSGATEVVIGSHLRGEWPTVCRSNRHLTPFQGVGSERFSIPDELIAASGLERRTIRAKAGDVIIIHVLVVHRAGNNYTRRARHAVINEYKASSATDRFGNSCAFAELPLIRGGATVMPRLAEAARM